MTVTTARYTPAALGRLWSARIPLTAEVGAYAGLFLAGFLLRFWDLGARALHHDESIHAQWAWRLMQGDYTHSPIFHGPFYYHFQAAVFFVFGTNDYTSRVSAAIAGTAIVLLPLLLRKRLGPAGTLSAVALLAFSPTVVYYSRFLREDIYMAFFVLLVVAAMWRYMAEGRERWLIVTAIGFVGGVTTKEGMFLTLAVFLVFLDLFVATELARISLSRQRVADDEADEAGADIQPREPSGPRLWMLIAAVAPFSVPVVAFWPFLGRLRTRMGWTTLPRSGDLLVLLGTLSLPLLTPMVRGPLESLGIVNKDIPLADGTFTSRLDWDDHLLTNITTNDRVFLAGLFLFTTSAAAFVGLQWKPKVWGICFLLVAAVYLTLMTTEWTNLDGLVSGPWGSIDYWAEEQSQGFRGEQPWYYYYLLFPAYEFLPLAIAAGGAFWAIFRGDAFSRFLVFWLVGQFAALVRLREDALAEYSPGGARLSAGGVDRPAGMGGRTHGVAPADPPGPGRYHRNVCGRASLCRLLARRDRVHHRQAGGSRCRSVWHHVRGNAVRAAVRWPRGSGCHCRRALVLLRADYGRRELRARRRPQGHADLHPELARHPGRHGRHRAHRRCDRQGQVPADRRGWS
ncbi:MAG: TIGR03663 family protein [Dehalococcoidia bacterium]